MENRCEDELLDEKGKAALRALLTLGYSKETIGEMLETLLMGEILRNTEPT